MTTGNIPRRNIDQTAIIRAIRMFMNAGDPDPSNDPDYLNLGFNGTDLVAVDSVGTVYPIGGGGGGAVSSVFGRTGAVVAVEGDYDLAELGDVSAAAQTANFVLAAGDGSTGGDYRGRALVAADIPNLAASKITSGQLAAARGGLGADASAFSGIIKMAAGVASVATANTDYLTPAGAATITDKSIVASQITPGTFGTGDYTFDGEVAMSSTSKTFKPPRVTTAQRNAIGSLSEGMVVYNTDTNRLEIYDGTRWTSAQPLVWNMNPTTFNAAFGTYYGVTSMGAVTRYFTFTMPANYTTITKVRVRFGISGSTGNGQYDAFIAADAIDEALGTNVVSSLNQAIVITANGDLYEINLDTLVGTLTVSEGDSIGVRITNDFTNTATIELMSLEVTMV